MNFAHIFVCYFYYIIVVQYCYEQEVMLKADVIILRKVLIKYTACGRFPQASTTTLVAEKQAQKAGAISQQFASTKKNKTLF